MARRPNLSAIVVVLLLSAWQYTGGVQGEIFVQEVYLLNSEVPTKPEMHLTETFKLPTDKTYYIVGFKPAITEAVAHHAHVKGCPEVRDSSEKLTCWGTSSHIYNWDHSTNPYYFPEGMGVRIGVNGFTGVELEIHYLTEPNLTGVNMNEIGFKIFYTDVPQPKAVAIFALATNGQIQPETSENFEVECSVTEDVKMHIFAYRVHSHKLGKMGSGYVVRPGTDGIMNWTLIGKKSPQELQTYYPIQEELLVEKGDILESLVLNTPHVTVFCFGDPGDRAARCHMFNFQDHVVTIGKSSAFEMCNFYFMYWIDAAHGSFPSYVTCGSEGPPIYYWKTDHNLNNVPQ